MTARGALKRAVVDSARFGPVVVLWSPVGRRPKVTRIILSGPGGPATRAASALFPGAGAGSCAAIRALCRDIAAALRGRAVRFSLELARLDLCPGFDDVSRRRDEIDARTDAYYADRGKNRQPSRCP